MNKVSIGTGAHGVYKRWTHAQLVVQRKHVKSSLSKTNMTQKRGETNYENDGNTSAKGGHDGVHQREVHRSNLMTLLSSVHSFAHVGPANITMRCPNLVP
jgi:hypothetical protein